MTIIIDGIKLCCDRPVGSIEPVEDIIISPPRFKRKGPSARARGDILDAQENRCFYCGYRFGSLFERNGTMGALRVVWDHLEPYCYKANNDDSNFVAACHICNGIKTDLCFRYVEDARKYIRERIEVKGYRITEI